MGKLLTVAQSPFSLSSGTPVYLFVVIVTFQLKEEFAAIVPNSKSLMAEFQPLKSKILSVAANSSLATSVLSVIDNELDEGNSVWFLHTTQRGFCSLPMSASANVF